MAFPIAALAKMFGGAAGAGGLGGLGGAAGAGGASMQFRPGAMGGWPNTASGSATSKPEFGFMDMAGSAMSKMPSGGGGKNPWGAGMWLSGQRDESQPNMGGIMQLMQMANANQQQQKQPMQMPMHPLIQQMLRMAGVQ